jgi:hypothetical protein
LIQAVPAGKCLSHQASSSTHSQGGYSFHAKHAPVPLIKHSPVVRLGYGQSAFNA